MTDVPEVWIVQRRVGGQIVGGVHLACGPWKISLCCPFATKAGAEDWVTSHADKLDPIYEYQVVRYVQSEG